MKSCPKCKAKVRDIDKFCHECGSNVKRDILLIWLFTILIIVSLMIVGIVLSHTLFISDNTPNPTNNVNPATNSVVVDTNCKKCQEYDNKCVGDDYYNCENIGNNCYDWVIYPNNYNCNPKTISSSDCKKCQEYVNKCVGNDYYHCENIGNNCYDWVIYPNNYNCNTKTTSGSDCKKCQEYDNKCVGNDYYHCENIGDNCYDWVIYPNNYNCNTKITSGTNSKKCYYEGDKCFGGEQKCIGNDYYHCENIGNNCYDWVVYLKNYDKCITKTETSVGTLYIKSYPDDAVLYLNDKVIGKTPYINYNIPVGNYNIKVMKAGYGNYCTKAYIFKGKIEKITALLSTKSIGCG